MTASPIRRVLLAAGSRGATAPLTAVAAALTTYIAIQYAGAATFGYISLLGTLFQLLPFSDLGLGAAVINAVSTRGRAMDGEQQARDVTSRAFKSLLLVGVIVVFLSGMFGLLNLWPTILATPPGSDPRVDAAAFVVFVLVGLAIPLGLGQRLLVADNATHIATLIMGTSSVVAVLTTALLAFLSAPPLLLAAATPAGILVAAAISTWLGARRLGWRLGDFLKRQSLGEANRQSLWKPALPMMVVLLGAPLALQSHRLILAHYGNPAQLAEYAVGSQFYAPALSVITTGALALWPHFAGANSGKLRAWRASMWLMTVIGVVGGVAVASALGPVSSLITGGELTVSLPVSLGFATLILLMSIHQPSAMLLTDTRGLWFQATCMVLFAAIALPASIAMVRPMGTAGPLFATSAAVLLTTVVPCITRAARNLHRDV